MQTSWTSSSGWTRIATSTRLRSSPARAAPPLLEGLIAADEQGYAAALALACEHAPGRRAWAIEGTGCYGKGPARSLARQGERVLEVERPKRQGGRGRAKSDRLDALRAARSLLAEERPALPRAAGARESLRVLLASGRARSERAGWRLCRSASLPIARG